MDADQRQQHQRQDGQHDWKSARTVRARAHQQQRHGLQARHDQRNEHSQAGVRASMQCRHRCAGNMQTPASRTLWSAAAGHAEKVSQQTADAPEIQQRKLEC